MAKKKKAAGKSAGGTKKSTKKTGARKGAKKNEYVHLLNGTAVSNTGGTILSYKNHQIDMNGNNSTPIAPVTPQ